MIDQVLARYGHAKDRIDDDVILQRADHIPQQAWPGVGLVGFQKTDLEVAGDAPPPPLGQAIVGHVDDMCHASQMIELPESTPLFAFTLEGLRHTGTVFPGPNTRVQNIYIE